MTKKRVKKLYSTLLSALAIGMLAATVWAFGFEGVPPALAQTNDPATGTPTLIGPLQVGEVLRVDTSSIEDPDGLTSPSFSYTWWADDDLDDPGGFLRALSIVNEYEAAPYDVGMTITVDVYFDDDEGNSESFEVIATSTVAAVAPDAPPDLRGSLGDPGELDLSWSTPAVCDFTLVFDCWLDLDRGFSVADGGSEITGYTVQWKLASGSWGVASHVSEAAVTTTSYTVTGLSASSTYTVRVLARNAVGAGTPSTEVTVTGADLNVGPVVSGRAMPTFFETNPRDVATYTATDPESDTITWSLSGADANFFSIANGVLNFDSAGDFEDPRDVGANNAYNVNIHAFDGDNTATFPVTVVISDVDEPPAISGDDTLIFAENTETTTVLHAYSATDPEGVTSFTWSLAGTDSGGFEISASGEVTFKNVLDYESPADAGGNNEYNIQVRAFDGNKTGTLDVAVTVTDECTSVGEPPCAPGRPVATSSSDTSLRITWSTPRTPSGTSITGYDLQYRESGGGGSWIPQSVAGTERSNTIENLTKDTSYEVQVRAMNDSGEYGEWSQTGAGTPRFVPPPRSGGGGGGGFGPAPIAPKFSDGFRTARTVPENARPGDAIGDPVSATHPDELDITYSLSGADAAHFSVDEETGHLSMKEGMEPVVGNTYTVNITATDSAGFGAIIIVTIEVVEATHHHYDQNRNGVIERDEVIMAVADYFKGSIEKEEVIELIKLYFQGEA